MKAKATKTDRLSHFVLSAGDIIGWQDERYIKTKSGFFAVLKIPGIDILGYRPEDQELAFLHFGRAEQLLKLPHKYLFMDSNPTLTQQKEFIKYRLEKTTHEYRRFLLQRQLDYFEHMEHNQRDRMAYLIIFSASLKELAENIEGYCTEMSDAPVSVVEGEELIRVLSNAYQIKWEVSDYAEL